MSCGRRKCIAVSATMKYTVPMIPTSARRAAHLVVDAPGTDCELPPSCAVVIAEPPSYIRSDSLRPVWLAGRLWHLDCTTIGANSHRGMPLTLPLFLESGE